MKEGRARVLVLAGLEPSGRAGLLADGAQVRALGGTAVLAATAVTAQGRAIFSISPVPPSTVSAQIAAARELGPIDAIKIGMVPSAAALRSIRRALSKVAAPTVVDPVVRTSKGEALSTLGPPDYRKLAAPGVVLTPNAVEAAWLDGRSRPVERIEEALAIAARLQAWGFGGVVLKGGHLKAGPADVVALEGGAIVIEGERVRRTAGHRGTGCRFASAMAVFLAQGASIEVAARHAKHEVEMYLRTPILGRR